MPTLGSGWYSYRVSVLRKFPIPIPLQGQDNRLFEDVANLADRLLNEKLNGTERANVLFSVDDKICKLYGISRSELEQYQSRRERSITT